MWKLHPASFVIALVILMCLLAAVLPAASLPTKVKWASDLAVAQLVQLQGPVMQANCQQAAASERGSQGRDSTNRREAPYWLV